MDNTFDVFKKSFLKNRIREVLDKKHLKQSWLSDNTGISRSTISNIVNERFEPYVGTALLIAKALNVRIDELFYYEDKDLFVGEKESNFKNILRASIPLSNFKEEFDSVNDIEFYISIKKSDKPK